MGKDPAFLFYPNDYIGGTMGMTFEEKGAYMELLMMQFNRGHMTEHMIGQTIGQLWDTIKVKFIQDDKGLWFNERLEEEKIKRQKFTESRRNNKSGKNQYSKKKEKESGHMTSHMENRDVNENSIEYGINSEKFILAWDKWKKYMMDQHDFVYKSADTEQMSIQDLVRLADMKEDNAVKLIDLAIKKGWKDFYTDKEVANKKEWRPYDR